MQRPPQHFDRILTGIDDNYGWSPAHVLYSFDGEDPARTD